MKTLNFKNKNGQLHAKAQELLKTLVRIHDGAASYRTMKLSSFYSSRSTNYPQMLDTELFVFSRDKRDIVNAGFAPTCKAIVQVNEVHPDVQAFVQNMVKEQVDRDNAVREKIEAIESEAKEIVLSESSFEMIGDFMHEVRQALLLTGQDKQNACVSAYKKLLNGRVVKSDFWKVFRHILVMLKVK